RTHPSSRRESSVPSPLVRVLIIVGLVAAGGFLVAVPMLGMRSELRYDRDRVRQLHARRERRVFWTWAITFPAFIVVGCVLGVVFHRGGDWFDSELIGAGVAAAVVIPATWITHVYLSRRRRDHGAREAGSDLV